MQKHCNRNSFTRKIRRKICVKRVRALKIANDKMYYIKLTVIEFILRMSKSRRAILTNGTNRNENWSIYKNLLY